MSTSFLLTTKSTVIWILPGSASPATALDVGTATISGTYSGTVKWSITTDPNCKINGNNVVLAINVTSVSATTGSYQTPSAGSGSVSGSKIAKIKMSNSVPMCEDDLGLLSIDGSCSYKDSSGTHTNYYTCTCEIASNQTKVSGLISST